MAPGRQQHRHSVARSSGWNARFRRGLLRWTAIAHVGPAVASLWLLRTWPAWLSAPIVFGIMALSTWAVVPLVLNRLPDYPRPAWQSQIVERSFLVHWGACHFSSGALLIGTAAAVVVPGARDWEILGELAAIGYLIGFVVSSWGTTIGCQRLLVRPVVISLPNVPSAWQGYRIVQLSDLHIGSFTSDKLIARWIDSANAQHPDLLVVTGDVVTSGTDFHERIARHLARLDAPDGVIFVPGNHDYFGDGQPLFGLLDRQGVTVLRNSSRAIDRGGARGWVVGVDDDWTGRADPTAAMASRNGHGLTIALAHNPAMFPSLADLGADLVLSGHTHGGQIAVPLLARWVSLTSWSNPYPIGLYRKGHSVLFVSAGLGCTALPIRIGVRSEVVVLTIQQENQ